MKVAVVILIVLGLLAAGAAAVLVRILPQLQAKETPMVQVLVAQDILPARTSLKQEHVKVEKMSAVGLPAGYFSNPAQVVGKLLKMEVAKGQILSLSNCVAKGSVDDLLRPGMLAFPAPLPRSSTPVDLLYPGCIVDVFATFPLRDRQRGDAVVTPLLQNIQVLAIGRDTVVPATKEEQQQKKSTSGTRIAQSGHVTVTLEVSARQAAALQLAMDQGTLGLAMRNPTDKGWNPMEPMVVKEGQLTAASEALDPQTLALFGKIQQMLSGVEPTSDPNAAGAKTKPPVAGPDIKPASGTDIRPVPEYIPGLQERQTRNMQEVTVIRGPKVEPVQVPVGPPVSGAEPNRAEEPKESGG